MSTQPVKAILIPILFTHEGSVDIGNVDAKALKLDIPVDAPFPSRDVVAKTILPHVPDEKKETRRFPR